MTNPIFRTKTVSTKVTEEEFAGLEAHAAERGVRLSEWCREVLLASANGQPPRNTQPGSASADHVLMAELLALRTILLNVLYKQVNGKSLTEEEMRQLIERADADKLKKAVERLKQGGGSSSK